jgi:hypothetical protein
MVQFKSIFLITVLGLIVLFSGCTGKQGGTSTPTLTPTPTATPIATVTASPEATPTTALPESTPKELPPGALYVSARMVKPAFWGIDKYELNSLQIQIINQQNIPLSITAQIVNGGQVLEENTFTLKNDGGSYSFTNQKAHFINNTNVTLRLLIQDYQPVEYNFNEVNSLS